MKKQGISGWLLIITLIFVLSGIVGLFQLFERVMSLNFFYSSNSLIVGIISLIFLLILLFFIWKTVYLILKKKKNAKNTAIITLWISLAYAVWYRILAGLIFQFNDLISAGISNIIQRLVFLAISLILIILLIFYFKKSERVRNTFIK